MINHKRTRVKVKSNGRIEISVPDLLQGVEVEVFVLVDESKPYLANGVDSKKMITGEQIELLEQARKTMRSKIFALQDFLSTYEIDKSKFNKNR